MQNYLKIILKISQKNIKFIRKPAKLRKHWWKFEKVNKQRAKNIYRKIVVETAKLLKVETKFAELRKSKVKTVKLLENKTNFTKLRKKRAKATKLHKNSSRKAELRKATGENAK